jgi:hypothetical protein
VLEKVLQNCYYSQWPKNLLEPPLKQKSLINTENLSGLTINPIKRSRTFPQLKDPGWLAIG